MKWMLAIALLVACKGGSGVPEEKSDSPPAPAMFGSGSAHAPLADPWTDCVQCHGPDGRGGGPLARSMAVAPQDLTDPAWQQATDDATIAKAIVGGGAALGKSGAMPAHPSLSPAQVSALVDKIRGLRRQ